MQPQLPHPHPPRAGAHSTPEATPTPSVTRCSQLNVEMLVRPGRSMPSRLQG